MHPPRTPEEDAIRNKTPPTRTVWGGMQRRQKPPVTLPKVAYNKRGAE